MVTEERIQSEIQQLLPNLGFLSTASKENDLKPRTKLEIPLWLADSMSRNRVPIITCEIPKIYKDSYKDILHAEACAVGLSKWNQYFYELGLKLPQTNSEEVQKIPEFLLEVFKSRFRLIMDWEQNPFCTPAQRGQLPMLEKALLTQGNHARVQLLNWLNRGVKSIETSDVLHNIRKRKRMNI